MSLLDKAKQFASSFELYELTEESYNVSFKGWKLNESGINQEAGKSVRLIVDGRIGFAGAKGVFDEEKLVENARESASFGDEVALEFPKEAGSADVVVWDDKLAQLSLEDMIRIGKSAMERFEDLRDSCDFEMSVSKSIIHERIINSSGLDVSKRKTVFSLGFELMRVKENDILSLWERESFSMYPEDIASLITTKEKKIREKLALADNLLRVPTGNIPVVLSPKGILVFLVPLLSGINGKNIYTKTSPIWNRRGDVLFDSKLSVANDGTISGKPSSDTHDDEGIPKRRTSIIKNGVLENFVFDLLSAARANDASTASAQRGVFSQPYPGTDNIVVEPGNVSYEDMLEGIKEGLLVEDVLGLGQGNVLSGSFSNPVGLAFKIENGELVGRVKDASIAGNIYDNFTAIEALSSEQKWGYPSILAPYVRLDNLSVVGK